MSNSNYDDPFKDQLDDPFKDESERDNNVSDSVDSTEKDILLSSDYFQKVEEQIDKDAQNRISAYENINKIDEINTIQSHEHKELLAITRGLDKNIKEISNSLSSYGDLLAKNDKNIRHRIFGLDSRITDCRKSIQATYTEFFDQIKKQQKKQRNIIILSIFGFLFNLLLITYVFWNFQNTQDDFLVKFDNEIDDLNSRLDSAEPTLEHALLSSDISIVTGDWVDIIPGQADTATGASTASCPSGMKALAVTCETRSGTYLVSNMGERFFHDGTKGECKFRNHLSTIEQNARQARAVVLCARLR